MDALPTARMCSRAFTYLSSCEHGSYKFLVAAGRDEDRGDRRGRDDFLFNRCASTIPINRLQAFNQLTLRTSSG